MKRFFLNFTLEWILINHSVNHILKQYIEVHYGRLVLPALIKKTEKQTDQCKMSDVKTNLGLWILLLLSSIFPEGFLHHLSFRETKWWKKRSNFALRLLHICITTSPSAGRRSQFWNENGASVSDKIQSSAQWWESACQLAKDDEIPLEEQSQWDIMMLFANVCF